MMKVRNIVITITALSCLVLSATIYNNLGSEGVFWLFLYSVFFQMCFALIVFSIGAVLSSKRSLAGPELMTAAGISFLVIVLYWILAVGALSIYRAVS